MNFGSPMRMFSHASSKRLRLFPHPARPIIAVNFILMVMPWYWSERVL
jgi:hypothetical protein